MRGLYKVHVGGKRWRWFHTLAAAKAFCAAEFERTGIILAIVRAA